MKTTIDIPEPLLAKAKERAAREGMTLRDLVNQGLRQMLEQAPLKPTHKHQPHPFKGSGLAPGLDDEDWTAIRALAQRDWPSDSG